jgi:hypothetical protein
VTLQEPGASTAKQRTHRDSSVNVHSRPDIPCSGSDTRRISQPAWHVIVPGSHTWPVPQVPPTQHISPL